MKEEKTIFKTLAGIEPHIFGLLVDVFNILSCHNNQLRMPKSFVYLLLSVNQICITEVVFNTFYIKRGFSNKLNWNRAI